MSCHIYSLFYLTQICELASSIKTDVTIMAIIFTSLNNIDKYNFIIIYFSNDCLLYYGVSLDRLFDLTSLWDAPRLKFFIFPYIFRLLSFQFIFNFMFLILLDFFVLFLNNSFDILHKPLSTLCCI